MVISQKWLFLLTLSFLSALILWTSNVFLTNIFSVQQVNVVRWFGSVFIPITFISWGLKRKSLSTSGAAMGFVVGFIITLSSIPFLMCLAVFFISSSKATKFRSDRKRKFEDNFLEGGQRNWVQVLANGLVASLISIVYINDCGCRDLPLDIFNKYKCTYLSYAVLGSFSCSNGDTWASELGPVFGWSTPILITTLRPVPKGTNGGVSVAGLIASVLGGAAVGFGFLLGVRGSVGSTLLDSAPPQWPVVPYAALGGLVGSLVDSILGATLQYSGLNEDGVIVEHPSKGVKAICGRHVLNNHLVNLFSALITSLLLPLIVFYTTDF